MFSSLLQLKPTLYTPYLILTYNLYIHYILYYYPETGK